MLTVLTQKEVVDSMQLMAYGKELQKEIEEKKRGEEDKLLLITDDEDVTYKIFLWKEEVNGIEQCVFLDQEKGCILGDRRPVCCRIYPFVYVHEAKAKHGCSFTLDSECMAHMDSMSIEAAYELFDMDYDRVVTEWGLYMASMHEHAEFIAGFEGFLTDFIPAIVKYADETKDRCRFTQLIRTGKDHGFDFEPISMLPAVAKDQQKSTK